MPFADMGYLLHMCGRYDYKSRLKGLLGDKVVEFEMMSDLIVYATPVGHTVSVIVEYPKCAWVGMGVREKNRYGVT